MPTKLQADTRLAGGLTDLLADFVPRVWEWEPSVEAQPISPITVEACRQRDGSVLFAVRQLGCVLSIRGQWEDEPIPSSRDDAFMNRCRFSSFNSAVKAISHFGISPNGRF